MPRERGAFHLSGSDRESTAVLAFLSDPTTHGDPAGHVEIIETHAALVVLVGSKAFKIKKRIKLPFLDFTTFEQRRTALHRELELNRDHAPDIYLGLSTIGRRPDGTLAFDDGDPVDVALVMNRFEQNELLARIAEKGPLPHEICKDLAEMAVRYHREAPVATGVKGAAVMRDTVAALASSLVDAAPASTMSLAEEFARRSREHVERLAPMLDARAVAGLVRRCHADLHLGNIVVRADRVVPFDALEFDERLATIDVWYDLAFLLMDLDVRGDRNAACIVLNAYVAAEPVGGEIDGLAALPLFLATRAAVRALVASENALQKPDAENAEHRARAVSYLTAANAYMTPPKAALVAVGGLSGTGKSTLAAHLAPSIGPAPGALVLRTDVERKRMFNVEETERLAPEYYTEQASDQVYAALYDKAERALAAGHGVIFDGVSAKLEEREKIAAIALRNGALFSGLWLEAPLATQIARVEARRGDASDSDANVVHAQAIRDLGAMTWAPIDAGYTPEHTLEQTKASLAGAGITGRV
ncbi:bifunctional aminoglycoside phosphotransferase/ATP-binding protein [uncultured Hyphomicrobium sp.]|uniref:bifunctional aminoglycoside phosphotransferase/ATP-binding protein n=1 Tax=uncultured Hyphomicrobium sp. TaxID=194373 RepID=UPI0025E77A30|nr:bifunctional aminoglycoside phosphotransferase/ATP-binding protein [uncultured Hyphomicrobium sp.]